MQDVYIPSPIVAIAQEPVWEESKKRGEYTQSTVISTLEEVGFIHCSTPDQTIDIANRHFKDFDDLILLIIDPAKVRPEIKLEGALSGRKGLFPHIYGPLNTDSVTHTYKLNKDQTGKFISPGLMFLTT